MDERATEHLRRLAREDAELAARSAQLSELDVIVGEIAAGASAIDRFIEGYPGRKQTLEEATAVAETGLAGRRSELELAQAELTAAGDDQTREDAARRVARAEDRVSAAAAKAARLAAELDTLQLAAHAAPAELATLHTRAEEVAAEAGDVDAPKPGAQELTDWSSAAHAQLFVGKGQIDARRERLIREASELASMLLGEPLYGATTSQALARVEASRVATRPEPRP